MRGPANLRERDSASRSGTQQGPFAVSNSSRVSMPRSWKEASRSRCAIGSRSRISVARTTQAANGARMIRKVLRCPAVAMEENYTG